MSHDYETSRIPVVETAMSRNDAMNLADVYGVLARSVAGAGGATSWAQQHNLSVSYVSDVLNARCNPGPAVLAAIGLRKVTMYQHLGEKTDGC